MPSRLQAAKSKREAVACWSTCNSWLDSDFQRGLGRICAPDTGRALFRKLGCPIGVDKRQLRDSKCIHQSLPRVLSFREQPRIAWQIKSNRHHIFDQNFLNFTMMLLVSFANETGPMSKQTFLDIQSKLRYVRRILYHRWHRQARVCPYCGPSSEVRLVRRKK